ncbi:hypothetical protein PIB30_000160 [Stylosanthes scabra]|uniref:Fe2OG dioxygenase domain-containing protein n=1 Tax=Stylosanthes scabra TaxID=79078 RepID=A0ABU6R3K8_9FABA|nr:hypothetical protein [Stylosanthes scabra]
MEEILKKKNPSGTSILVPCVQELAKQKLSSVPARYIQRQQDEDLVISEGDGALEIPVIDFQRLLSTEYGDSELAKLHLASKHWGFFQLVNHGVSTSLLDKVKLGLQDFFNLPMSEKKKFWQTPEHIEGFGQAFVHSEDQKLDWADIFYMLTQPKHLRIPHLFPQLPFPFRETMELYSQELKNLAIVIISQMAKALKIEEVEMRELFDDGIQMMRMNYYPPCPEPEKVVGISSHSDPVAVTILLQASDVEGLQIRKDGILVPVKPLPNAFIINIGDILEIITNGIYQSIEHRATVNNEKERLSIATFYSPNENAIIGPAQSLITEQTPPRYKSVGVIEYFEGFFARKLIGKSYRDVMKIENNNHHD